MSTNQPHILVTGASGQLGTLVIEKLLETVPAGQITAMVRNPEAGAAFAARGVAIKVADYAKPETLGPAFEGVDRALLISSNAVGQRSSQHRAVIDAAAKANVKLLAYTSLLHADTTPARLAEEHVETEAALRASGVPFALLRNGWYTENTTAAIPSDLAHGAHFGCAGEGRFSSAARADYAAAAAAVLTADDDQGGRIYELAGDEAFTLADFAAELSRQAGKPVSYTNLPEAAYAEALTGAGFPKELAAILADADTSAAGGALFDDSRHLSTLIGRPTTPFRETIAAALAG